MRSERGAARTVPARGAGVAMVEQLLLATDGTLTPMLECVVGERIVPAGLVQAYGPAGSEERSVLAVPADRQLLFRSSNLVGAESGTVYVEARAIAVPEALPVALRDGLRHGQEPIGRLLRLGQVETFREILHGESPVAAQRSEAFRRYRIFIGGVPALLITETFFWNQFWALSP